MADPLSIIAGTVGICDVCWRVFQYLQKVRGASGSIQREIEGLQRELSSLRNVNEALEAIYTQDHSTPKYNIQTQRRLACNDNEEVQSLWLDVNGIRKGCKETVEDVERLLEEEYEPLIKGIVGKGEAKGTSKWDNLKKQWRRQSISPDLSQFRLRLANYQGRLQVLLTALNM